MALWRFIFQSATADWHPGLVALLYNVVNESFGYVAYRVHKVDPATLAVNGVPLEELTERRAGRTSCRPTSPTAHIDKLENGTAFR